MRSFLLAAVCVCVTATPAPASDVLVVRSHDLAPHLALEDSFLASVGAHATRMSLTSGPDALASAMKARPRLVVAIGQDAARTVSDLGAGTPLLCALVPYPEQLPGAPHAVPMFADPRGQLEALRAVLPATRRVGVLYDASRSGAQVGAYARSAEALGLTLVLADVRDVRQVSSAARGLVGQVDALWLVPDPALITADPVKFLVRLSLEARLPLLAYSQAMARAGALVALEPSFEEMGLRAAVLGRRLLAGERAAPDAGGLEGALYLNARAATLLGLPLPEGLRSRAAKVFE
jgi:putative tryptophan/tyrosine transport system substrate-binding protein